MKILQLKNDAFGATRLDHATEIGAPCSHHTTPVGAEPPGGYTGDLCGLKMLDNSCTSRTSQFLCTDPEAVRSPGGPEALLDLDSNFRGACRWVPTDSYNNPCGAMGTGKCVLDTACTHFAPAKEIKAKDMDKLSKHDNIENVLDSVSRPMKSTIPGPLG